MAEDNERLQKLISIATDREISRELRSQLMLWEWFIR